MEKFEQAPEKEMTLPKILDVVRLGDRWAQVIISGRVVRYLDTKKEEKIDWNQYRLIKLYKTTVGDLSLTSKEKISEDEVLNIRWGENEDPALKKMVTVFGAYEKK